MPWLTEVTRKIRRASVSDQQGDALVLQLMLLAGVCHKHVPLAPELQVETVRDEGLNVHVSWLRREPDRVLTLIGEVDGRVALFLYDGTVRPIATSHNYDFMPEDLRIAVTSFFDGWQP